MKIKSIFMVACIILHCIPSLGQRQQTTEEFSPNIDGLPTTGKKTYSYIIGEDGKKLKDGLFSISGKPDALVITKNFTQYTIGDNGHFKLNTTFQKGNLHGAFTFSYGATLTVQGLAGNGSENHSMTFNGHFFDGWPHGTFNIQYKTDNNHNLSVSYDKGVLVGPYSVNCLYENLPCIVNGKLTSKGELTGKWNIFSKDTYGQYIFEFQNGILVRKTTKDRVTRPAVTEFAKKYATGSITEDELFEHGIIVLEDSIPLGWYANSIIFRNDVLDFGQATGGGYDFTNPNHKRYKYLEEVSCFTEEGFDFYTQMLEEKFNAGNFDLLYINDQQPEWGYIGFVNERIVVFSAELATCSPYIKAQGVKEYDVSTRIYLTKEQEQIWLEKLHEARKLNAVTFGAVATRNDFYLRKYFEDSSRVHTYNEYENMREEAIEKTQNGIDYLLSEFIYVPNDTNYLVRVGGDKFIKAETMTRDIAIIYLLADKYDELVKITNKERRTELEAVKKAFDEKYEKDLNSQLVPFTNIYRFNSSLNEYIEKQDKTYSFIEYINMKVEAMNFIAKVVPEFTLLKNGKIYQYRNNIFKRKELDWLYIMADKYDELEKNTSEEGKEQLENLKKIYNKRLVNDLKKTITPIMDKLLNQSATSIAYEEGIDKYFSPNGLSEDLWRLEFSKKLKPFGKITGYEIMNFYGENYDEVECIITTLGKKKAQNKYKVTWKIDREGNTERIIANSIDINNAILVTNE